jgi:predicted site-specific integrase-resolvase
MNDEIIYARVPSRLRADLERERKRMSKKTGTEVKTSAVIRAILEQALRSKRRATNDTETGARA